MSAGNRSNIRLIYKPRNKAGGWHNPNWGLLVVRRIGTADHGTAHPGHHLHVKEFLHPCFEFQVSHRAPGNQIDGIWWDIGEGSAPPRRANDTQGSQP